MSVRKRKRPPTANRWGDLPVRRDQAVLAVLTEQWTPAHAIELAVADDAAFRLDPSDKRAGNSLERAVERCIARPARACLCRSMELCRHSKGKGEGAMPTLLASCECFLELRVFSPSK
jgi:hypothetical protein